MFCCVKTVIGIFFICVVTRHKAQTDSLSRRHISAIHAEICSAPWAGYASPTQAEFQEFIPADNLLYVDLTGFTKQEGGSVFGRSFEGMAGLKVSLDKKAHFEYFAGLRYGQAILAVTGYNKSNTDTIGSFTNPITGNETFQLMKEEFNFSYNVIADRLYAPIGITFFTKQKRVLWVSAGLELCPFISFGYRFQSSFTVGRWLEHSGDGTNNSAFSSRTNVDGGNFHENQNMAGYSAGGYLGVPLSLNFHPFAKNTMIAGRFHFFLTLTPGYIFTSSQFDKPAHNSFGIAGLGLRYHMW